MAADQEYRDYADMIVTWAEVQKDDQVLEAGSLRTVLRTEHLAKIVFVAYEWPDSAEWTTHHVASMLTAVRRPVQCSLCGAVLVRDESGTWIRRDEPRKDAFTCSTEDGTLHEPTALNVPDHARLRLALADLEEANARRCHH